MEPQKFVIKSKTKIILVINDVEYPVARPKLGESRDLENEIRDAQEKAIGGSEVLIKILTRCGLPEDVVQDLDGEEVEAIMEALRPSKKN